VKYHHAVTSSIKSMERRRYPRIPLKLHATLIGEKTVPRGCRIINLSQQGALLQCERNGRPLAVSVGEAVEVHFTLRCRTDDHRRLRLRATVGRVTEQHVGIEFEHPAPELMRAFEAYGGDDIRQAELDQLPQVTAIRNTVGYYTTEGAGGGEFAMGGPDLKLRYLGLSLLAFAMIALTGAYISYVKVDARFSRLERAVAAHARTHGESADQGTTLALLETQMDQLKGRMDQLEDKARENHIPDTLSAVPPGGAMTGPAETGVAPSNSTGSQEEEGALRAPVAPGVEKVVRQPEMRSGMVKPDIDRRGPWVINLLSSRNQDAVNRFSANARAKDIPVTQTMAQVKGTQYWRAQLTGFATADEAKSYAETVKSQLGLKEVWIFRGVN
jgi:hypothetical protein